MESKEKGIENRIGMAQGEQDAGITDYNELVG